MEGTILGRILALLDSLHGEAKLDVLESALAETNKALGVHQAKARNGAGGERVACKAIGLRWNKASASGCDAWDAQGRAVELKCFNYSKRAAQANINYRLPRRKKSENDTAYRKRVTQYYHTNYPGGHYWVMLKKQSTVYVQHWHLGGTEFARILDSYLTAHPGCENLNLGSKYCKTCTLPHRAVAISQHAKLPQRVQGQCRNGMYNIVW